MKISLWDSKTLLVLLAASQSAALVYASVVFDGHVDLSHPLFWLAFIRGLALGIAVSFSASYAGYQLPRVKKVVAQKIGWYAYGASILFSGAVVAICSVEPPSGWLRWIVGVSAAGMVEASILAVAMSSSKMFQEEQPETTTKATTKATGKKLSGKIDPVVLVDKVKSNPKVTNAELAQLFGVSPQAVQKHRAARQFAEAATKERNDG